MANQIHVVGAVIINQGLVLCARRGMQTSLPGLWEFPGGKIEEGESPVAALIREIHEELGIELIVGKEITTTSHQYEFGTVNLTTFYCEIAEGAPVALEHDSIAWHKPEDLQSLEWAPADVPAVVRVMQELS